jgi:outer membrane receptor for ferrienterochelin and colicin
MMAQTVTVSGRVIDIETRNPLPDANVYVQQLQNGQAADREGRFSLRLPTGNMSLRVSFSGYTTQTLELTLRRDTTIQVLLRQDNRLPEVQVLASRRNLGILSSQMSAIELPIREIQRLPTLLGETDIMKALQLLPGVQAVSDGNAGIYVRGGNYDQNQITLDGATIYNTEHLKGFISAIDANMVSAVALYKGAFPARYGSRLSSVVEMDIKEGDYERYHGGATVGLLSSSIHAEGPLQKGKTSFNVAARMSYFDLLVQPALRKMYDDTRALETYGNMNYYDVNLKLAHKFSENNRLTAFFYVGNDRVDTEPTTNTTYAEKRDPETNRLLYSHQYDSEEYTTNTWGNTLATINWSYKLNEKLSIRSNAYYSRYHYHITTGSVRERTHRYGMTDPIQIGKLFLTDNYTKEDSYMTANSGISELTLAADFHYRVRDAHNLRWGVQATTQSFNPTIETLNEAYQRQDWINPDSIWEYSVIQDTIGGHKLRMNSMAIYIEDDIPITSRLQANAGLRYALYSTDGTIYQSLEPRLSARYSLNDKLSLKAGFSSMRQAIHLLSNTYLVSPSDMWVPVTKKFPLTTSLQWSAGLSYEPNNTYELSLEGYYKQINNLYEYKEGSSFMQSAANWEEMIAVGKGWSYGVELFARKKIGKTTGWLSYTWSKSMRLFDQPDNIINAGKAFYAANDYRHNLSITMTHQLTKDAELSWIFQYHPGQRRTLALDYYYSLTQYNTYIFWDSYKERNGFQLPAYHRMDVSLNFYTFFRNGAKGTFNISLYNLYNHKNISVVYAAYEGYEPVLKGICILPLMPSISYTYEF